MAISVSFCCRRAMSRQLGLLRSSHRRAECRATLRRWYSHRVRSAGPMRSLPPACILPAFLRCSLDQGVWCVTLGSAQIYGDPFLGCIHPHNRSVLNDEPGCQSVLSNCHIASRVDGSYRVKLCGVASAAHGSWACFCSCWRLLPLSACRACKLTTVHISAVATGRLF